MRQRTVMVLDTRRCVACSACVIACKTENAVPPGGFRAWVVSETDGTFPNLSIENRSERCNHCADAPCIANCPTGASFRGPGGTVQIDRDRCTGCKACIAACPYGARYVHPDGYVDKCTFCAHRGDGTTACAQVCPTECITFGDAADPGSAVSRLLASRRWKVLSPEAGTEPHVYYLV